MARWIRGFLAIGVLAAPNGSEGQTPGHPTFAKNYRYIPVCLSHDRPKVLGDLQRHRVPVECEDGHNAKSLRLRTCSDPGCGKVLVYPKFPVRKTCDNGTHGPAPILEGNITDPAHKYRKPKF